MTALLTALLMTSPTFAVPLGPTGAGQEYRIDEYTPAIKVPLPTPLSSTDSTRYRQIFGLQEDGNWREAAALIEKLDNRILLGHVQAQKYLHPTKYRSRFPELFKWTQIYNDHPQARRIYRLASKRQLKGWKTPVKPTGSMLHGNGARIADASHKIFKASSKRSAAIRSRIERLIPVQATDECVCLSQL